MALLLSFLIGFERVEQKMKSEQDRSRGVRRFPLPGLLRYAWYVFSGGNLPLPSRHEVTPSPNENVEPASRPGELSAAIYRENQQAREFI